MSEYLKELETWTPGKPEPPANLGPFDNPLLWNKLDPYGNVRSHQRRPTSVSYNTMELYDLPLDHRDQCAHRMIPLRKCLSNLRPMVGGSANCHEFEHAWALCRSYETYRFLLLKQKFQQVTKDYTTDDKNFFPTMKGIFFPYYFHGYYWSIAAASRLESGMDDNDPQNPLMNREPNRAMMRAEFNPTRFEKGVVSSNGMTHKLLPRDIVEEEVPSFPLPEGKRPF